MKKIAELHIGVDVSKKHFDICLYETGKNIRIQNNDKEITKFIQSLNSIQIKRFVYEATGGFENLLTKILVENNISPTIVNPRRIRSFAIAKNIKAKTDAIDAQIIASFAASPCCVDDFLNPTPEDLKLREFTKRIHELIKMRAMEKNRLSNPRYTYTVDSIKKHINFLNLLIETLITERANAINENPVLKKKLEIMITMKGIGETTAQNLIGSLPELGTMNNKKISAIVGVAPIIKQSGQQKGFAKIEMGRLVPRQALFLATMTAIRFNPVAKEFYERLKKKGKKPMVALVAVMRKLLVILNTMIRKGEYWSPISS